MIAVLDPIHAILISLCALAAYRLLWALMITDIDRADLEHQLAQLQHQGDTHENR